MYEWNWVPFISRRTLARKTSISFRDHTIASIDFSEKPSTPNSIRKRFIKTVFYRSGSFGQEPMGTLNLSSRMLAKPAPSA